MKKIILSLVLVLVLSVGVVMAEDDRSAVITSPSEDGLVSGFVSFDATLTGGDNMEDNVQWAVRKGTCAAGTNTVFGNVDGKSDVANWDGETFHIVADTLNWVDGDYCFVFNPTESAGDTAVRETRDFTVVKSIQERIGEAEDGDEITVEAGTYGEQITIDNKEINLKTEEGAIIRPAYCASTSKKGVIEVYNSKATVEGFTIDANWDGGSGCLLGIYALGGCGIEGYNDDVEIVARGNTVFNYGKNGITANCELATATIEGNTVIGRGPLPLGDLAQNGIQLGWEASGEISGNKISEHYWDGCSQHGKTGCTPWVATGVLLYLTEGNLEQNARIKADNTFTENQFNVLRVLIPGPYKEKLAFEYSKAFL